MAIPFTQYLRPDGRQVPVEIERPADVEEKAKALIAAGCRFTVEELRTLEASFTCERGDEVLAIQVCPNGPPVLAAVDQLVADAFKKMTDSLVT